MPEAVKYHKDFFPPNLLDWEALIPFIGPAHDALGQYNGTLHAMPNAAVLLSPLTTQEAVLSSKIEGTQATMGEVLEFEADPNREGVTSEKRDDIEEIRNYREAMGQAHRLLKKLPLCQRVVKEAHRVLLRGVRGQNKSPGQYRKIPNWIGPPGCSMEEARYVPISAGGLSDAMGAWEKYIHTQAPDRLVQLAVLHAEFEALHPFLDGNGRLGRMLVPLFLASVGMLSEPMFYISAFFERNREEYYERLLAVSRDRDWTPWVLFFLKAVTEQARENQGKAKAILSLYEESKIQFHEINHSQYSIHAVDFLFRQPIFPSSGFYLKSGIPESTAKRILALLRKEKVVVEIRRGRGRRAGIYAFQKLVNIAEGKKVL